MRVVVFDVGVEWSAAARGAYESMWSLVADVLAQDLSVVIDCPSHYETIPEHGARLARYAGARYRFVECVCGDDAVLAERLLDRPRKRSQMVGLGVSSPDAPGVSPGAERLGVHGWRTFGPDDRLVVDTTASLEHYLPRVLAFVSS